MILRTGDLRLEFKEDLAVGEEESTGFSGAIG